MYVEGCFREMARIQADKEMTLWDLVSGFLKVATDVVVVVVSFCLLR